MWFCGLDTEDSLLILLHNTTCAANATRFFVMDLLIGTGIQRRKTAHLICYNCNSSFVSKRTSRGVAGYVAYKDLDAPSSSPSITLLRSKEPCHSAIINPLITCLGNGLYLINKFISFPPFSSLEFLS